MKMPAHQALQYNKQRLQVYLPEEIDHCERSKKLARYVTAARTENSAHAYKYRLQIFASFIYQKYDKAEVDTFVEELQTSKHDPLDVLQHFLNWLKKDRQKIQTLSANVINSIIRTTKKFLRFSKVKIDTEEFNIQVQLLRRERPVKHPIDKATVTTLLNGCQDIRLRTIILGYASLGSRPVELCAVRNRDIDIISDDPTITFRAEFSKMREARRRRLTEEFTAQCRLWRDYKYRTRRTSIPDRKTGKLLMRTVTPKPDPDDLFFGHIHFDENRDVTPQGLKDAIQRDFAELIDLLYTNQTRSVANGRNRNISLKTFRDFVKTTLADAINSDYSEWFIGHSDSTYHQRTESMHKETFHKAEPYLTYLDISALEAGRKDQQSQIDNLKETVNRLENEIAKTSEPQINRLANKNVPWKEIANSLGISEEAISEFMHNILAQANGDPNADYE
jgi:hypothetical protein